jgi:hypothetical protein
MTPAIGLIHASGAALTVAAFADEAANIAADSNPTMARF